MMRHAVAMLDERKEEERSTKSEGAREYYLVCIFFHVAHRAKQLSKGQKLSNRFALSVQTPPATCVQRSLDNGERG